MVTDLARRLGAFVVERHPLALAEVLAAYETVQSRQPSERLTLDAVRRAFSSELSRRLHQRTAPSELPDATPGTSAVKRLEQAYQTLVDDCDGFFRRAELEASLTLEERREMLRGMLLTRAVDNELKTLFMSGSASFRGAAVPGKGFRSRGQEAIYAAALRLRRGPAYRDERGRWTGDVVAPMIRDLGVALAMRSDPPAIRAALNAQVGKAGPPLDGKDLNVGDLSWGVLVPAAPLAVSAITAAGIAMAFWREGSGRVAVSFIGDGGSSLGEWHEAVNLSAARRLPIVFCVQNNQAALSTPVPEQSAVRVFADKAVGYGIPGLTLDGTDPDQIAAGFEWGAERARAGLGPTLIELVSMRMCGHAHHDDMLYLGRDVRPSWEYEEIGRGGYVDRVLYEYWSERDPIVTYARRLEREGVMGSGDLVHLKEAVEMLVRCEARSLLAAPWPRPENAGAGVIAGEQPRRHVEPLDPTVRFVSSEPADSGAGSTVLEPGPPMDPSGRTFLEGVTLGIADALRADPRTFVYGEDVGGSYGNVFLLLRPLIEEFGDRLINAPIAEAGILGVCVGAALAGQRPIGEIQFNDFVASGFNQLVNNAAKIRYRCGADVPMVVRMPFGGLRHAGPYHSQNTEAWFYRTPGLKIVVPSTPHDARALLASAVADPDPVLFFEHIALYRDPRLRQVLGNDPPAPLPLGRAALRRSGSDLVVISYGAYLHVALRVAEALAGDGIEASVLDLRCLAPLDRKAILDLARRCHRVLVVHEDTRTGGIGESVAAIIQEEAFESLDAPVRVVGALDTPVPYSPPLEEFFLPSEAMVERAARLLLAY